MVTYKLVKSLQDGQVCAVARSDGWQIPFAEGNTDYAEYLKWLDEGNTPLSADTPE